MQNVCYLDISELERELHFIYGNQRVLCIVNVNLFINLISILPQSDNFERIHRYPSDPYDKNVLLIVGILFHV